MPRPGEIDQETRRLLAVLKRIQNDRKMGISHYILMPRRILQLLIVTVVILFLTGFITDTPFFRLMMTLFGVVAFFMFYLYPRHPEPFYKKENTLLALLDQGKREEILKKLKIKRAK